jgi:hypothetical protein
MINILKYILDIVFRREGRAAGKVIRELRIGAVRFGELQPSWRWKRVFFRGFEPGKLRTINPHMAVFGESGSGKSNAAKLLIKDMASRGVSCLVFDVHGEYAGLAGEIGAGVHDASCSGISVFELHGASERERTGELTGMFKKIFRLGDVQSYVLHKCISYTYYISARKGKVPGMDDLLFTIKVFMKNPRKGEEGALNSLENRMGMLRTGSAFKSIPMADILTRSNILVMSRLRTKEAQAVYVESVLRGIYGSMLGAGRERARRLCIVVDEAEKISTSPALSAIANEGRKYGIGIMVISQRPKSIDPSIRSNASVTISFYTREPEELNYISNLMAGGTEMNRLAEIKRAARNLPCGHAIILQAGREPFIVRFRMHENGQEYVNPEVASLASKGVRRSELLRRMAKRTGRDSAAQEVAADAAISSMLSSGELSSCAISPYGKEETWYISKPRNSAEHDIMVNIISRRLTELGVSNRVYNGPAGPDVIGYIGKAKVAFEYETGKREFARAVSMLSERQAGYDRVVVVASDSAAGRYREAGFETYTSAEFTSVFDPSSLKGSIYTKSEQAI